MPIFTFANNINTTLASPVSTSSTSITLASTANLPASIPAGEVLVVTLNDAATRQNFEIVYATARTGATLTVERAHEGTASLAWLTGDYAYSPPTAGQQESFGQLGAPNTWTGANVFDEPVVVPTAVLPDEAVNANNFPSSLLPNGYKKYPDPNSPTGYFIEQWGGAGIPSNGSGPDTTDITLPTVYPTVHLWCMANWSGTTPPISGTVAAFPLNIGSIRLTVNAPASAANGVFWFSKGY